MTEETALALRCIPGVAVPPELAELLPAGIDDIVDAFDADAAAIAPMPVRLTPYAHQIAAYNAALEAFRGGRHGYAFLHEQGCGKTLTTQAVMGRLYLDRKIRRVLIVAPLAVLPVWEKDCADMTVPYHLVTMHGTAKKRQTAFAEVYIPEQALQIIVINYDGIRSQENITMLQDWAPDMIICDESQKIKNHKAQQSKALHALGLKAAYRMILTGTPIGNTPLDFWSQYKFLDPGIFEKSYYAFRNHYAVMGGYGGYELVMYKHLDDLTQKAHSIAHRVTKDQALDLPERIDQTLYCELEPAAAKVYKQMERDKVAELSGASHVTANQIITQLLRLSQIAGGYLADDETKTVSQVSTAKLGLLKETMQDIIDRGEKVVVFTRFIPELLAINKLADGVVGVNGHAGIWGAVPGDQRGEAVRRFQEDPDCKIFVAQIQCAGAGITLHAASTAIFYSLDYSYMNYDQAKARIHRIGQHHPCTYIHLVAKDTVDEDVLQALAEKRSIATDIVDNWRTLFAKNEQREEVTMNFVEDAGRLLELKARKNELNDNLKALNAEIDALSNSIVEGMDDAGMETFAAYGTTFYIKQSLFTHLPAEKLELFIKRLRARKLGHIVRPVVNAQTLRSFVKEQVAECGGIDELPAWISELVEVYIKPEIATRKR